jgi:adenine-specific DNA-methyltransferase
MEVESQQIERDYVKVLYKNSDVKRYFCSQDSDERIIYFSRSTDENLIPNIIKHLFPFKSMLENRREVSTGRLRWFDLWWPRDKSIFMSEKIVCPQRSNTNTFGYTELSWFATSDVFFITKPNPDFQLKYILAILNSKLIYFWLYNRGKRKGETLELTATPISQIPIAKSKKEEQLKYISIVDQILAAKKGNMFEDTSALESEIDLLVYHLYGLTYDDVLIVDPETPITKEEYNNNKK